MAILTDLQDALDYAESARDCGDRDEELSELEHARQEAQRAVEGIGARIDALSAIADAEPY